MGLKSMLLLIFIFVVTTISQAAWISPIVIISGKWGSGEGMFGLLQEDTSDNLPDLEAILSDNKIIINDTVNDRILVYDQSGNKIIEVHWLLVKGSNGEDYYQLPEYGMSNIARFMSDGSYWTSIGNVTNHYSDQNTLLATYDKNPLEIGNKTARRRAESDNRYDTTVQYEDITYHMILDGIWNNFVRDRNDFLYFYTTYTSKDPVSGQDSLASYVVKYDPCGKKIGELNLPISEYEQPTQEELDMPTTKLRVRNEYGPPVIGPDGSIYCWKRTPDSYSLLKWTWVDSPDDPKPGPDAPTNLKLTPSLDGLYLTWGSSPQDPGCVDGYELERSTTADGIYSTVTTTDPGVLKFNDTGALSGTTYFYKVRAKGGGEYSPYTVEVSGTRQ